MKSISFAVAVLVASACGSKQEEKPVGEKPVEKAATCPAGQVSKDGACVVVVTPEEVEEYGDSPYLVIQTALREGKVVYGA